MTDPITRVDPTSTDSTTERMLQAAEGIVPAFRNPTAATLLAAAPTVIKIAKKVLPVVIATASRHPLAISVGIVGALFLSTRRRRQRATY